MVAPFREVITDYGKCIRRLNNAFQTNFSLFNHTKINVNYVMSQEGYHAGPSDMRENLKHQYEEKYESLVNGKLCKISNRADKIYEKFLVSGLCPPKSLQ